MESKKIALITGVNGMDGSHLADLLLSKGYIVYGMERRSSVKNRTNTKHLEDNPDFHFVIGDMSDSESLRTILFECEPDEIYNLAAQSFVGSSWKIPLETSPCLLLIVSYQLRILPPHLQIDINFPS